MKTLPTILFLLSLFLIITPQETTQKASSSSIRRKRLSTHGQVCDTDSNCEPGLYCKFHTCLTIYEFKNYKTLGLSQKSVCDAKNRCPTGKICINYRCENQTTTTTTTTIQTNETDVHLLMAGNIYSKKKIVLSGKSNEVSYNYTRFFKRIKYDIKSSDIAIINPEIIFGSQEFGINHKKNDFVSPDELGNALVRAGFNLILQTNEHINDKGVQGIELTQKYWKSKKPRVNLLGLIEDENEDLPYYIYQKKNLKIGIISYATSILKTLSKKSKYSINFLSSKNEKKIIADLKILKLKCDFIVACVHWGQTSSNTPNNLQMKWAKFLSDNNVDLILGTHPNSVQPVAYVEGKLGKRTLVYFSLGDLVSSEKNPKNTLGALASVIITKKNGKTFLSSHRVIPLVTDVDKKAINYQSMKLSEYSSIVKRMENAVGKIKKEKMEKLKKWETLCRKVFGYLC